MKYLWRVYYFFKGTPTGVGKTATIRHWIRINGTPCIELKMAKTEPRDLLGHPKWRE